MAATCPKTKTSSSLCSSLVSVIIQGLTSNHFHFYCAFFCNTEEAEGTGDIY